MDYTIRQNNILPRKNAKLMRIEGVLTDFNFGI